MSGKATLRRPSLAARHNAMPVTSLRKNPMICLPAEDWVSFTLSIRIRWFSRGVRRPKTKMLTYRELLAIEPAPATSIEARNAGFPQLNP
jgi:hypothetical protein